MTTSLWRGMSTSMFLRLWTRTPRTAIQSCAMYVRFPAARRNNHHSTLSSHRTVAPDDHPPGKTQAVRRLLGADVRVARLDHRIGLAARRAQRRGSGGTGVGPLVDPRGRNAVAAGARLRRAGRGLSGGRRRRTVPLLLPRPDR